MDTDQNSGSTFFVGIDGGGSGCRARLRDGSGRLRGSAKGGPANLYLDFETALGNIEGCMADCLADAGLSELPPARVRLGLGLAGVSAPDVTGRLVSALSHVGGLRVASDAEAACLGAHGGQDGGLIVAGTGSIAVARISGQSLAIGGRGFIMGDDGSGARMGLDAMRRALRAHDGLEQHSTLTRTLMARFNHDPAQLIQWARTARSSEFAAWMPDIFDAAANGDRVGCAVVRTGAAAIAELGEALSARGVVRICLVGGLAGAFSPFLPPGLTIRLVPPLFDAVEGALLLAGCPMPAGPKDSAVEGQP